MPSIETLRTLIRDELTQCIEEGRLSDAPEATEPYRTRLEQANTAESLLALYHELRQLPIRADFPYVEPDEWEALRAECPPAPELPPLQLSEEVLFDRLYGVWLGRVASCMLGKPLELRSYEVIRQYLEGADAYPLTDYFPPESRTADPSIPQPLRWCTKGYIHCGERDDDTDYTVLNLLVYERYGSHFTTADVGWAWLHYLPAHQTYTAERRAYTNLLNELPLEEVPRYLNPYREWIGARIRADLWGYVAPGDPARASEYAYRDARLSHTKNGIYGAMLTAGMIATAFATHDIVQIIQGGLSQIPAHSREAEMVRNCLRWRRECADWYSAFQRIREVYGHYHPVHTLNNDALVLNALLWGWDDFEQVITIAVMQGWDTDCNGATAGSIWGASFGAKHLPDKWIAPLNDTLQTGLASVGTCSIRELAERTLNSTSSN